MLRKPKESLTFFEMSNSTFENWTPGDKYLKIMQTFCLYLFFFTVVDNLKKKDIVITKVKRRLFVTVVIGSDRILESRGLKWNNI